MKTPSSLTINSFQLGSRYYVNPSSNEIGFIEGTNSYPVLKVEPRLIEVLVKLANAKGQVVSKEKLIAEIWDNYPGSEEALLQSISKLRKILQDDARNPEIIETIAKKGYRLLVDVIYTDSIPSDHRPEKKQSLESAANHQVGLFTGFIERLSQWRFLSGFLVFSTVLIIVLALLYQIIFWLVVSL